MNNFFRKINFKSFTVLLILLISSVSVFAAYNSNLTTNEPLHGVEVILSLSLLLFIIVAPAFKRRERTTFIGSNHKYFTI